MYKGYPHFECPKCKSDNIELRKDEGGLCCLDCGLDSDRLKK